MMKFNPHISRQLLEVFKQTGGAFNSTFESICTKKLMFIGKLYILCYEIHCCIVYHVRLLQRNTIHLIGSLNCQYSILLGRVISYQLIM